MYTKQDKKNLNDRLSGLAAAADKIETGSVLIYQTRRGKNCQRVSLTKDGFSAQQFLNGKFKKKDGKPKAVRAKHVLETILEDAKDMDGLRRQSFIRAVTQELGQLGARLF